MSTQDAICATATLAHSLGIPVLPIKDDGTRAPDIRSWRHFQESLPDEILMEVWFDNGQHKGVALVTGQFSGIEALDFDDPNIYDLFKARASEWGISDLLDRVEAGYLETTPRQGHHLLYRPETVARNTRLALRPSDNPQQPKVLIETRGEGGYVVVAPSSGECHATRRPWVLLRGGVECIAEVTDAERDALFELARSFNTYERPVRPVARGAAVQKQGRPGDAYNSRASWDSLLSEHGWTKVRSDGSQDYWAHPGKTGAGHGATTNFNGSDRLYVFTTNSVFDSERSYSKFEAYAILEHSSDFGAAARALAKAGYGALGSFERTDLGNSDRFVEANLDEVRFCHDSGVWLVWDGTRWKEDAGKTQVFQRLRLLLDDMRADAEDLGGAEREAALGWLKTSRSRRVIDATLGLAPRDIRVAACKSDFDADDWVLNVLNGTIDLRSGMLRPHDSTDLLRRRCDVEFIPGARHRKWEAFIDSVTEGDDEYAVFLQKVAGLALLGRNIFERIFILFGPGGTGKSTFLEALKAVLGEYAAAAEPDTFAARMKGRISNDVARMLEYRTAFVSEVGEEDQLAMPLIKQLTGGDSVAARKLYQEAYEGVGKLNVFMAVNQFPKVSTLDSGARRRIVALPFQRVVPEDERDHELKQMFVSKPGMQRAILAWAVEGCVLAQKEGLSPLPAYVAEATSFFWQETNPLSAFVQEQCVLGEKEAIGANDLWEDYEAWCEATRTKRVERSKFHSYLSDFGVTRYRTKSARIYRGIRSGVLTSEKDAA